MNPEEALNNPRDLDSHFRAEEQHIAVELEHLRAVGDKNLDSFLLERLSEVLDNMADEDREVRIYINQDQASGVDSKFFEDSHLAIEGFRWGTYTTTNTGEVREGIILLLGIDGKVLPMPLQRIDKVIPLHNFLG
ncbi:MAG: hypothetical protein WD061_01560 [Candidatus Saccharimonadales bacterium]